MKYGLHYAPFSEKITVGRLNKAGNLFLDQQDLTGEAVQAVILFLLAKFDGDMIWRTDAHDYRLTVVIENKEVPMSSNEQEIEAEIQAKGKTAPRLTPDLIDREIEGEDYYVFPGTTVTVCALRLHNGYIVVGKSAAASRENFDEEIGRKVAREDARNQIWALEGYLLREKLHEQEVRDAKASK